MAAMAGSGAIVRQGHLRKLKTMRKKYFVLRADSGDASARLEYYESEKKFRAGVAPRRVLPLKSCYNITRRLDLKQKHVIALFTREEQLCIVADNEQDLHAWLAAILKQHRSDDASQELLHPIQHVWQVNVQKKGLGASKNIQGLYNLCLTDKTVTLVKIKSHNNIISDLGIPERVEYSLKNIRRCGDSECFFYMEVGRQTATGSGELWMHSDDSNIAQSMHSTILHAMRNCAKETENEKDHIVVSGPLALDGSHPLPERRQSFNSPRLAGLYGGHIPRKSWDDSRNNYTRHEQVITNITGQGDIKFTKWPSAAHARFFDIPLTDQERSSNVRVSAPDMSSLDSYMWLKNPLTETPPPEIPTSSSVVTTCFKQIKRTDNEMDKVINVHETRTKQEYDAVDHLFQSYAQTFKSFSKQNQIKVKMELAKLFATIELEEMQENSQLRNNSPIYCLRSADDSLSCEMLYVGTENESELAVTDVSSSVGDTTSAQKQP